MTTPPTLDVFISHSSRDAELAKAIVELLRSALSLPAERIRCTSVAGYKLPVGADTNDQLRRETVEARVLLGLITEVSVESAYVLFELGARWGARRYLAPLIGAGRGAELLAGPLSGLNALSCSRDDLYQLISDIAGKLACVPAGPQVYTGHVDRAVHVSEELAAQRGLSEAPATTHSEEFSEIECDYLMEISRPRNEGFITGSIDDRTGREVAVYQAALQRYYSLGLMDYSSGGYRLTPSGWSLADQLWKLIILDALETDALKSDEELSEAVGLTDGPTELDELRRLLKGLQADNMVVVIANRQGGQTRLTAAGATHRKHRPLQL